MTSSLVGGIVLLLGFLSLVLPGLFLLTRLYPAPPAVMLDDRGPLEALGESWLRTDGHTVTVFGVVASVAVFAFVTTGVVFLTLSGGIDPALTRIRAGETLSFEVSLPSSAAYCTLLHPR